MNKLVLAIVLCCSTVAWSQNSFVADTAKAKRIISFLASDRLAGRANFSPQLDTAAQFIADYFKQAGLEMFPGDSSYLQPIADPKKNNPGNLQSYAKVHNVIGILRGDSLANEVVIFSAHYDHVGTDKSLRKDKVFNGANDNASGTTALLMLAKHFGALRNNKRSIIFCAFAAEEHGLIGSSAFQPKLLPASVKAVINIEMIGLPAFGAGKFFITGADYSTFSEIFCKQPHIKKLVVNRSRVDEQQGFFYRSDNAPFVYAGIAAHTIMTSDDLTDKCYHKPCDEWKRININHLSGMVQTIITGCAPIISGKETPQKK